MSDKKGFIVTDIPRTCLDCQFCYEIHEDIEACCSIMNNPNDTNLMREIDKDYCQEKNQTGVQSRNFQIKNLCMQKTVIVH